MTIAAVTMIAIEVTIPTAVPISTEVLITYPLKKLAALALAVQKSRVVCCFTAAHEPREPLVLATRCCSLVPPVGSFIIICHVLGVLKQLVGDNDNSGDHDDDDCDDG